MTDSRIDEKALVAAIKAANKESLEELQSGCCLMLDYEDLSAFLHNYESARSATPAVEAVTCSKCNQPATKLIATEIYDTHEKKSESFYCFACNWSCKPEPAVGDDEVEKVARAVCRVHEQNGAGCWEYYVSQGNDDYLELMRDCAEAAIAAMTPKQQQNGGLDFSANVKCLSCGFSHKLGEHLTPKQQDVTEREQNDQNRGKNTEMLPSGNTQQDGGLNTSASHHGMVSGGDGIVPIVSIVQQDGGLVERCAAAVKTKLYEKGTAITDGYAKIASQAALDTAKQHTTEQAMLLREILERVNAFLAYEDDAGGTIAKIENIAKQALTGKGGV